MKQASIFTKASAAIICLCLSACATASTNQQKPLSFFVGAKYLNFSLPRFTEGSAIINQRNLNPLELTIAANFELSRQHSAKLSFSYFNAKSREYFGGGGQVPIINGNGTATGSPITSKRLEQQAIYTSWTLTTPLLVQHSNLINPYVGLVYTSLKPSYQTHYVESNGDNDSTNFNLTGRYYGLALGNNMSQSITSQFKFYTNAQIQLLHNRITMNANQLAQYGGPSNQANVHASHHSMAFLGQLEMGFIYQFDNRPNSPSVSFNAGAQYLSAAPRVISATTTTAAKVKSGVSFNDYIGIGLNYPI